jgi:tRNA dimethylallyltransferase
MDSKSGTSDYRRQRLLAIVGPTASGKSALAVELARSLHSEILSVDSRQVYRGLDLGTGKDRHLYGEGPNAVPVHLVDVVAPDAVFNLFDYQKAAFETLESWRQRRGAWHPLILCGGSGLYLEAILRRFEIANIPENAALREHWMQFSKEELWKELCSTDPEWAKRTDGSSKKRIVRALEIAHYRHKGAVALSSLPDYDFDALVLVVEPPPEVLKQRIQDRLHQRLEAGLIAEVQSCREQGMALERLQMLGLEYREVGEYLAGLRDAPSMQKQLQERIEQFAKRQGTWFRGMSKRGLQVRVLPWSDNPQTAKDAVFREIETVWPDLMWRFDPNWTWRKELAIAAIRNESGQLLLLQRSHQETWGAGQWGLPGGHLSPEEQPADAMKREIREELGEDFEVQWEMALPPVRDTFYSGHLRVHLFRGLALNSTIRLNEEHDAWAWVSPSDYPAYPVVTGVDEDLAYLQFWPIKNLNQHNLQEPFRGK